MPFRALLIATLLYVLMLVTITHLPPKNLPDVRVSDKIEHFVAYFGLSTLVSLAVAMKRGRAAALGVLLACSVFGALDELTQPYFGRTCDVLDWTADVAGVTAAAACVTVGLRLFDRRRRSVTEPVVV